MATRKITCPNKKCRHKMSPMAIQNNPERFFCPFCGSKLDKSFKLISVYDGPRGLEDVLWDIQEQAEQARRPKVEPPDYRP